MTRSVDDVELVLCSVFGFVVDANGIRLDRDAALTLEIHIIEQLIAHVALRDRTRAFQEAICQRGLTVVDVSDDAEVTYARLIHGNLRRGQVECTVVRLWCYPLVDSHPPREVLFVMANIQSKIKRNKQNIRLNERNSAIRSELKTRASQAVAAAESGDTAKAEDLLRVAQKRLDMAVTKGVLHKRTASRRKSRLSTQVRSLLA